MRGWIWFVVLLAAAVGLALVLHDHGGNVLIIAQPWRIELSLSLAVVLVVVGFVVLHGLLRCLYWLGSSPGRLRAWRGRRAQRRDTELLESGWINVLEGRYVQAEKDLSSLLEHTRSADRKVLAGLSAARALHLLGEYPRRDQVLLLAREGAGQDTRLRQAVDTVTAEMYLDQNRAQEALDLLAPWQDASSRFLHGTRLLLRAHRLLGHADRVHAITRLLLRRNAIDPGQARQFIGEAAAQRLALADEAGWKSIWSELTPDERLVPEVALAAALAQERFGHPKESARLLEAALGKSLDERLLRVYSRCDASQAADRLGHAELWLKSAPDDPGLLAALGQLCLVGQLWGQGEHYLNRSLALRDDTHVHALLGNLDDALGRRDGALAHWRRACEAADVAVVEVLRLLPAADTAADPKFTGAPDVPGAFAAPAARPTAASGAWLQDSADDAPLPAAAPDAAAPAPLAPAEEAEEEYFDTAPIPGIDLSQTPKSDTPGSSSR